MAISKPDQPSRPIALVTTRSSPATVSGLAPGTGYLVSVRSHPASAPTIAWGPAWTMLTAPVHCNTTTADGPASDRAPPRFARTHPESRLLRAYRISEYSFDVDFLENHNAASVEAIPLYLMTCDPMGNCAPWSTSDLTGRWDECLAELATTRCTRGGAFSCMACADAHRAQIEAACGPFSDQDTLDGEGSFAVHWFCGVGWPESVAEDGPITEYCVEYLPLPEAEVEGEREGQTAGATSHPSAAAAASPSAGFANYLSCNSVFAPHALRMVPRLPRLLSRPCSSSAVLLIPVLRTAALCLIERPPCA